MIQNVKQKLDSLIYSDFEKHVAAFLSIVGELANYDSDISETEKTSKVLRSLPPSFAPLAMVSSLQDLTFDKVVNAVQAKIAQRSNHNNP